VKHISNISPHYTALCIGMNVRGKGWEDVDGMHLAQNRGQWRPLVNMIMELWVP